MILESKRPASSSIGVAWLETSVAPPAKLPNDVRGESEAWRTPAELSSSTSESDVTASLDAESSSSPCNSAIDRDAGSAAGGVGGNGITEAILFASVAENSVKLWTGPDALVEIVADAAGCTSSCEPIEINDGAGFFDEIIGFEGGAIGFGSIEGASTLVVFEAGLTGGEAGAQEISDAVGVDFALASGCVCVTLTEGGDTVLVVGAASCAGNCAPQKPTC